MRKTGVIFKLSWVTVLALVLSLGMVAATDGGEVAAGGEFELEEHEDGVKITDYLTPEEKDVVIPEEIEGEPVIKIGEYAFVDGDSFADDGYGIETVGIPDSVEKNRSEGLPKEQADRSKYS